MRMDGLDRWMNDEEGRKAGVDWIGGLGWDGC